MAQTFWKSMAFMGVCFVLMAATLEIYQWVTTH